MITFQGKTRHIIWISLHQAEKHNAAQHKFRRTNRSELEIKKSRMRDRPTRPAFDLTEQRYLMRRAGTTGAQKDCYTSHRTTLGKIESALALALEIILPRLAQCCIPDRVCMSLSQDPASEQRESRRQQIRSVKEIAGS
jgi:hypothetical protein